MSKDNDMERGSVGFVNIEDFGRFKSLLYVARQPWGDCNPDWPETTRVQTAVGKGPGLYYTINLSPRAARTPLGLVVLGTLQGPVKNTKYLEQIICCRSAVLECS